MTRIALAPCSPFSVTDDLMRRTAELARAEGVRLHTHLAETRDEEAYCQRGLRLPAGGVPAPRWAGSGHDVWLAHCVHLSRRGGRALRRDGHRASRTAPAPTSASARASRPCATLLDAGAPVGLGVDGSASNDSSNMLAEARQALLAHRLDPDPARWLTAEEVLWMATRGGARCLGRDDIGSLEPGKAADLILVDTRRLSYAGASSDPLAALVFSPWPEPVDTVMVNGRVVVEGGQLVGVDVPALVASARTRSREGLLGQGRGDAAASYSRRSLGRDARPRHPQLPPADAARGRADPGRAGRGPAGGRHAAAGLRRGRAQRARPLRAGARRGRDRRRRPRRWARSRPCRT